MQAAGMKFSSTIFVDHYSESVSFDAWIVIVTPPTTTTTRLGGVTTLQDNNKTKTIEKYGHKSKRPE
jgi:hypothetical protein